MCPSIDLSINPSKNMLSTCFQVAALLRTAASGLLWILVNFHSFQHWGKCTSWTKTSTLWVTHNPTVPLQLVLLHFYNKDLTLCLTFSCAWWIGFLVIFDLFMHALYFSVCLSNEMFSLCISDRCTGGSLPQTDSWTDSWGFCRSPREKRHHKHGLWSHLGFTWRPWSTWDARISHCTRWRGKSISAKDCLSVDRFQHI